MDNADVTSLTRMWAPETFHGTTDTQAWVSGATEENKFPGWDYPPEHRTQISGVQVAKEHESYLRVCLMAHQSANPPLSIECQLANLLRDHLLGTQPVDAVLGTVAQDIFSKDADLNRIYQQMTGTAEERITAVLRFILEARQQYYKHMAFLVGDKSKKVSLPVVLVHWLEDAKALAALAQGNQAEHAELLQMHMQIFDKIFGQNSSIQAIRERMQFTVTDGGSLSNYCGWFTRVEWPPGTTTQMNLIPGRSLKDLATCCETHPHITPAVARDIDGEVLTYMQFIEQLLSGGHVQLFTFNHQSLIPLVAGPLLEQTNEGFKQRNVSLLFHLLKSATKPGPVQQSVLAGVEEHLLREVRTACLVFGDTNPSTPDEKSTATVDSVRNFNRLATAVIGFRVLCQNLQVEPPSMLPPGKFDATVNTIWDQFWEAMRGRFSGFIAKEMIALGSGCNFAFSTDGKQVTKVPAIVDPQQRLEYLVALLKAISAKTAFTFLSSHPSCFVEGTIDNRHLLEKDTGACMFSAMSCVSTFDLERLQPVCNKLWFSSNERNAKLVKATCAELGAIAPRNFTYLITKLLVDREKASLLRDDDVVGELYRPMQTLAFSFNGQLKGFHQAAAQAAKH